jgi:hypothetical protein
LEHSQGQGEGDLWDVLRTKDECGRIENRRQDRDRVEHKRHNERDHDWHGPYYAQLARHYSPTRGWNAGGIKPFSHNLKRVHWPLNFKPSGIDKYAGSTNTAEWLEVYQLAIEVAGGDSYVMTNYLPICLSL